MSISAIVLAGGVGSRMGSATAKQFLPLGEKLVIHHCLEVFFSSPDIQEVIVVCETHYQPLLQNYPVKFALPGQRRQDSLYQGFLQTSSPWICIHDAARPFISLSMLEQLFKEGKEVGAAVLAIPMRSTVKLCQGPWVEKTLDRQLLWEAQTPQFLSREILQKGFEHVHKHSITVTDDVMLAELIGHPTKLVTGSPSNIKLTTAEDYQLACAWSTS